MELKLHYMKYKEIKPLREKLYKENDCKCCILNKKIPFENTVLDHKHKRSKKDEPNINNGYIRNVIDKRVNSFLGKIENAYIRYGLHKEVDLPYLLRRLADYIEEGKYIDINGFVYIHPKEVIRKKKK